MTNTCNLWTYFVTHDKSKANLLQVNHHLPLKWGLLKKQATSWMQLFKWGLLHWNLHRMPASFRCFGQNWRKRTCKRTWTSWASAPWLSSWLQCFGKYSLMKFGIFWTCSKKKTFQIHWFLESLDLWPGQQLLTTQRDLDDRISVLNKCGYELKKTLQELKEEKERSAELAKVVKMLDNQWVGVTADKEWSIAMQCTLGKKCLAWLLQCNALWGLRCLSYQGYTWKSSTIWHAWALFVRPVEDSSGADLFFAMKHGKIQSQETTISSQLTLTCSLLKGCLENKYPAKSHFPGLDHLLLICQWLCSRLSKLNVRWITVSFDLHTSALWIVLWVLNWMKCCIPPKSCQVTLLYDTTRLFLWIWGKKRWLWPTKSLFHSLFDLLFDFILPRVL